jgi:hypothetical protein
MLWLYQRHALKAFQASVGDEEGNDYFVTPKNINSRCSQGGRSIDSLTWLEFNSANLNIIQ